jgi:hypothetical protein|eukprot:COSAG01_NODE_2487_length_7592_cov_4.423328_3_plen_70_part_00
MQDSAQPEVSAANRKLICDHHHAQQTGATEPAPVPPPPREEEATAAGASYGVGFGTQLWVLMGREMKTR